MGGAVKLNGEICLSPFLPFTLTVFIFNQSEQPIRTWVVGEGLHVDLYS